MRPVSGPSESFRARGARAFSILACPTPARPVVFGLRLTRPVLPALLLPRSALLAFLLGGSLLLLLPSPAIAVPESVPEPAFQDSVEAWCRAHEVRGDFNGREGVRIAWAKFEAVPEEGALVILPGRTECTEKYHELVYDLRDLRYSIYLLDHAGQGRSGRLLRDREKGTIGRFDDYVSDLQDFLDRVVDRTPHRKRFLLAHSMGGCIGVLYLAREPREFDSAIISSPMLEIDTSPLPELVAWAVCRFSVLIGQGDAYAPGRHGYDPVLPFEGNDATHSRVRFERNQAMMAADPALILGGPTRRWVYQAIEATRRARRDAAEVGIPILLLQAGKDLVVRPGGQDEFCRRAGDCREIRFPGASHEILMEADSIRDRALLEIRRFLARRSGRADLA
jgi:lysophospholipase